MNTTIESSVWFEERSVVGLDLYASIARLARWPSE